MLKGQLSYTVFLADKPTVGLRLKVLHAQPDMVGIGLQNLSTF